MNQRHIGDTQLDTVLLLAQDPDMLELNARLLARHEKLLAQYTPPEGADPVLARRHFKQSLEKSRKAELRNRIAMRSQPLPNAATYVDPMNLPKADQQLVETAIAHSEGWLQALEDAHHNYCTASKADQYEAKRQLNAAKKAAVEALESQLLNQYAPQVYLETVAGDELARNIARSYLKHEGRTEERLIAELTAKAKDDLSNDPLKYLRFVFDGTWETSIQAHLDGKVRTMQGREKPASTIPNLRGVIEYVIADRAPASLAFALQQPRETQLITDVEPQVPLHKNVQTYEHGGTVDQKFLNSQRS